MAQLIFAICLVALPLGAQAYAASGAQAQVVGSARPMAIVNSAPIAAPTAFPSVVAPAPGAVNAFRPLPAKPAPQLQKPPDTLQTILGTLAKFGSGAANPQIGEPGEHTDWDSYEYPKDYTFSYGGKSGGDIGNGLCTAKNANRTQVKEGYCAMLADLLTRDGSCAKRAMDQIMAEAGSQGNGIEDLHQYCSTYGQLTDGTQKVLVFQQVLATLITQESGWNAHAAEKPWSKNGKTMGGKGLFQIGVDDRTKDPDCAGLNDQSILDPATNLKCGACIALSNLAKDRTMGKGQNDDQSYGMARYFGPLRDMQSAKRNSMANAVNQYCVSNTGGGTGSVARGGDENAVTSGSGGGASRQPAAR